MLIKKTTAAFLITFLAVCPLFVCGAVGHSTEPFPLSVEENKDSVVRLFTVNIQDPPQIIQYGTGFFVENNRPDHVTLSTVFHFFLLPFLIDDSFDLVMEYRGKTLSLSNGEVSFSPVQDTALVHIPKEMLNLSDDPTLKPLRVRETPLKRGESLYAMGFLYGNFHRIKATHIKPHPQDLGDFAFILNRTQISGASGAPLLDQAGKLVFILKKSYLNYGFGSEVSGFNELIQAAACRDSFQECIFDAGTELYQAGKAGNAKAQALILQLGDACVGCFDNFMKIVGITDQVTVERDRKFFEKSASKVYLSVLYPRIYRRKNREEIDEFWSRGQFLARQGYPHIQHILCKALNDLEETPSKEDVFWCFQEPAHGGFSQSQWIMAKLLFDSDRRAALKWLEKSAAQGHPHSCHEIQHMVCSEEWECDEIDRIYHTVEEICQDVRLASIPYVPEISMYSLFSFPISLVSGIGFGMRATNNDDDGSISFSRSVSNEDWFKVSYDNGNMDSSDFSMPIFGNQ